MQQIQMKKGTAHKTRKDEKSTSSKAQNRYVARKTM